MCVCGVMWGKVGISVWCMCICGSKVGMADMDVETYLLQDGLLLALLEVVLLAAKLLVEQLQLGGLRLEMNVGAPIRRIPRKH